MPLLHPQVVKIVDYGSADGSCGEVALIARLPTKLSPDDDNSKERYAVLNAKGGVFAKGPGPDAPIHPNPPTGWPTNWRADPRSLEQSTYTSDSDPGSAAWRHATANSRGGTRYCAQWMKAMAGGDSTKFRDVRCWLEWCPNLPPNPITTHPPTCPNCAS
jgi:hypothetical protein